MAVLVETSSQGQESDSEAIRGVRSSSSSSKYNSSVNMYVQQTQKAYLVTSVLLESNNVRRQHDID